MCYTAIHSIDAGVYVLVAAAPALDSVADVDQVIEIQLTAFFAYFFFLNFDVKFKWLLDCVELDLTIYRSSLQSLTMVFEKIQKTCWASAWETCKLTFCRLFKNGCLGYRFRQNNNKTFKSRPVYLGRIFSQQLFVNCWKRTQFWRAT